MRFVLFVASLLCFSVSIIPSYAEEKQTPKKSLFVELNSQKQVGPNCQVSSVMKNDLGEELKQFVLEVVIFDENQQI